MNDREFINNLIKVYFSNAKEPHQATLDNAITNRLNDIADKLENQEKVLEIIIKKCIYSGNLINVKIAEDYNDYLSLFEDRVEKQYLLTEEEFNLIKRYCENV